MHIHEPNNQSSYLYTVSLAQVFHYSTKKNLMCVLNFIVSEYERCSEKYLPGITAILLVCNLSIMYPNPND